MPITELQDKIGYRFTSESLLRQALTHRSRAKNNNERLEFLGDSVLGLFVAQRLYQSYSGESEGRLTRMRARLVRRESLAAVARGLALSDYLLLGGGELKSGGHDRDSILADALEAVIGAVYLDGGHDSAFAVLDRLFADRLAGVGQRINKDSKSALQELLQKDNHPLPVYRIVSEQGPDHDMTFTVSCTIPLRSEPFLGTAASRKQAEQSAAESARVYLEQAAATGA